MPSAAADPLQRAIAGCLLGTAVGDALGLPCEGLSRRRQARMFPRLDGYRLLPFGKGLGSSAAVAVATPPREHLGLAVESPADAIDRVVEVDALARGEQGRGGAEQFLAGVAVHLDRGAVAYGLEIQHQ